jgi:hypothetical protein
VGTIKNGGRAYAVIGFVRLFSAQSTPKEQQHENDKKL